MNPIIWSPSEKRMKESAMFRFMKYLDCDNYADLHKKTVENPLEFWSSLFSFFSLRFTGELSCESLDLGFKTYNWFPHVKMNFAENLLSKGEDDKVALCEVHESGRKRQMTYAQLRENVSKFSKFIKSDIKEGDVLACFMPNISHTVIAMLGTSSLGGVFTSTSCDFGVEGVVDRFSQSKPKILLTVAAYQYAGKTINLIPKIREIEKRLPSLEKIIVIDFLEQGMDLTTLEKAVDYQEIEKLKAEKLDFVERRFDDELYIMYSSGTTGRPKCIVHSVGGVLLQHLKEHGLHTDLNAEKKLFYFTTCGWMMWNWPISGLYFGGEIILYEGSPGYPSLETFFSRIQELDVHIFGTSPKFLKALEDTGYQNQLKLESLETILSTGAPLLPEQFDFVYNNIKKDVLLASICGGTDILGCFMLGNPLRPVRRGEIQSLALGMDVACVDSQGNEIQESEGELVCKKSFPSRPIYFLNDEGDQRLHQAYFEKFDGLWHHGDFIRISNELGVNVLGRSDATLNPGGVRIGTAEIYRQTESLCYLEDSICVGKMIEGDIKIYLFVKLNKGESLTEKRVKEIKTTIREKTTPRHVPAFVLSVKDIPYTRSGKKMELLVNRLINGKKIDNKEAVANPECLHEYQNREG